jgi:gamma-glutamyltranspeptidase/glutathione hydrolase
MDVFYRGPIAKAIACQVREAGGWLDESDLAAFKAEWREPIAIHYKGYEVFTTPPPLASFQLLETLNLLGDDDVASWGHNSVEHLHQLIEAIKLAVADRLAYAYSEPVPVQSLLDKAYAQVQRRRIDPQCAGVSEGERFNSDTLPNQIREGRPQDFVKEHTTHFACADSEGNVVTVTQTLGGLFEGFMVPGTGILLNNILEWLDVNQESAYCLRPGRKPSNNMSPAQVARNGQFVMSIGTPGSYGIMQTTAQMLMNVLDFGLNIQEAIEAPRIRVYRERRVDIEGRVSAAVRDGLAQRGHQVNAIADWTWSVGGGQGIVRDPETGAWQAGADPRRDGYALAW